MDYDIQEIRRMPASMPRDQVERILETGFRSLTSAVIAESVGAGPRALGSVLGSREYCETWRCALMHVRANLSHKLACLLLEQGAAASRGDRLFQNNLRTRDLVAARLRHVAQRVELIRGELDAAMDAALPKRPVPAGWEAFLPAHEDEFRALVAETADETAVAAAVFDPPDGAEHDPVWAEKVGVLKEPRSDQVRDMLWVSEEQMKDRVAEDARTPGGLHSALRHPLVLPRWGMALDELAALTGGALNLAPSSPVPDGAWLDLPGDYRVARERAGRMRFFEAIQVRRTEWEGLMYAVSRQIRFGMRQQRLNVEARAREKLARVHEDELAMYAALTT